MKSDGRASSWSITINNPTDDDEENIAIARQRGWKVDGQKEVGQNGTPHYQLFVKTGQVRFKAVKDAFPRAHIEAARDNKALEKYVHKEETKVGELPESTDHYPSQQKVWDMFSWWITDRYEPSAESISGEQYLWSEDEWLVQFDKFTAEYIVDGYVLEGIAVNPQTRSSLKKFGRSIYFRSKNRNYGGYIRRQTDRQTDSMSEVESIISEVDIPEDGTWRQEETTVCSSGSETTPDEAEVADSSDESDCRRR